MYIYVNQLSTAIQYNTKGNRVLSCDCALRMPYSVGRASAFIIFVSILPHLVRGFTNFMNSRHNELKSHLRIQNENARNMYGHVSRNR